MRSLFVAFFCLAASSGCTEIASYATAPGEEYQGEVAGSQDPISFLRRGFPPGTVLHMSFDPLGPAPGTLTTSGEPCGVFTDASLKQIPPLSHDQLSLYDFPGGGRLRNFIYAVEASTGPLAGRNALAFVSLMDNKGIEVRIIAGSGQEQCSADCTTTPSGNPCDFFGLFRMKRVAVGP